MRILHIIITCLLILLNTTTQAKTPEKTIGCPSIDTIHKIALLMDEVDTTDYSTYVVSMSDDPKNQLSLPWFIMAYNIAANNENEAIEIAQKRCNNVTHMVYQNARKGGLRGDEYSCLYYDGTSPNPFTSIIAISMRND